ncbi:malto-oligosyltrehalose trehalohydrolase [Stenotrophomonas sp. C1657]|uniref:malto-oligosyltrehalose trehalohydrolase n=1 Tax=Stenotrophomonas sp. C1657 TaxID=3077844 RepID=UPI00293CC548|nr:malto-oligosyltrehalose trehalohydrolase [Stenotrophomonas sp. C1657]MDV3514053.1 malto-oligosyltrehalose trehalohydrolase [Stenotrophomonas sp. C1657]
MTTGGPRLGAWPAAGEGVEFRVWAPDAATVALCLQGVLLPMQRDADGCHWVRTQASHGDRYRFRLASGQDVPDPASRWQPDGVDGDSAVVLGMAAGHAGWPGHAWQDLVICEVHIEASGGLAALTAQLPMLAATGITAIELMPVAQFPGQRNWGYDGVFAYAPANAYGGPSALKAFVDAAHDAGLSVLLDVVYNHFGPQGNHLRDYARGFFRDDHSTPWGEAIDFRQPWVRRFFIDNALMWLRDYGFDGLRLDAVHAIDDDRFLQQLADEVHAAVPQAHLILENERNQARWLRGAYQGQWNDDFHNALHVMLTGEQEGYYAAYAGRAETLLARCLAEGFAWQGEPDLHGQPRGEPSGDLSPARFVVFAQNHDQVGNRAFGERLSMLVEPVSLRAALALTLLTPMVPLLFMGEPWQARSPFLFFTDYAPPLDEAVREGRRREFSGFAAFADPASRARIPDPNDPATLQASYVPPPRDDPWSQRWLRSTREILALRSRYLQPGLLQARSLGARVLGKGAVQAGWQLPAGQWWIAINVGPAAVPHALPAGDDLLGTDTGAMLPEGGGVRVCWVAA